jgi:hypothetical protein
MTTTSTPTPVLKLAVKILDKKRKMYERHDEDVARWYRSADGKYKYPTCIHGTSTWTDYDNICGDCENGYTYFDYARDARESLDEANVRWTTYWALFDTTAMLRRHHAPMDAIQRIESWAATHYLVVK